MTAFWVISGIFIVTALLFIIPTLLRNKDIQLKNLEHDAINITVYRDQLAELDKDLENDILSQEQYSKSKQELQQRMLQDVTEHDEVVLQKNKKNHNIVLSVMIALMFPLGAVFLYLNIGDTRGLLPQEQLASATQMNRGSSGDDLAGHDFSAALEALIARLSNNPEDIEGWIMLGRTYTAMERYTEASNTYAKLVELIPNNPQILSDYARVLGLKNQGTLAGKPTELLYEALRIDPEYPPALALAGHAEFEQEKYNEASVHWEKLLTTIPSDSPLAKSVKDSIAEAKLLASSDKGNVSDQHVVADESTVETDIQPVNNTSATDTTETIALSVSGQVNIQPELASKVTPSDTLFIYARASTGPKMPLAILRLKASDLPATFTLTDDMAMMPTMKMSSFPEIVIEARISKSGQAVPSSGDLQGFSKPVKLGSENIAIVIDKQIP
ncbi:c-type cytochrome biogenesis protein CcmI [Nitrosomonas ureae]|uniref:Cytochrome c-type biogenesis protein CcmH n=1 Tax=Nitrosomonas ureae TaxID=44577 RepID=A0A1H5W4Z2_9PROT|nr:c-type cytochrome biogenesis protein CcmI [Nitrosomonas ureae]SEF94562.1 cytochrome c-type biogenesis protein CcmH [Nitrosomonas ureae]